MMRKVDIMDKPIFENSTQLQMNADMVSFADCPNKCNHGSIFEPYKHKFRECPYCAEKRKSLVSKSSRNNQNEDTVNLMNLLNLPPYLMGIEFSVDCLIPQADKQNMDSYSYTNVTQVAQNLVQKASVGDIPEYSMLFNFGAKANIMTFVYPLMLRYYLAGKTVAPLLTGFELCKLRNADELGEKDLYHGINYESLLEKDICVICIDGGTTERGYLAIKGLLDLRALHNKVTILVTTFYTVSMAQFEKAEQSDNCKYLATPYYVIYDKSASVTQTEYDQILKDKSTETSNVSDTTNTPFNSAISAHNTTLFDKVGL